MSLAAQRGVRIAELEAEIIKLRRLGRTRRDPIFGIGGTIQSLREGRTLGVRELAALSGTSAGSISRLEQEEHANPRLQTLIDVATGLGIKVSELLAEDERRTVALIGAFPNGVPAK